MIDSSASAPFSTSIVPLDWRLYWHTLGGTWKAFGLSRELLLFGIRRPLFTAAMRWALTADHVFYPGIRKTEVREPVFLIGHPRSGTTFLHRLLTQTREFSVFEFWEILCPALTARWLARSRVQRVIQQGKGTLLPKDAGHLGALDQVEEEEMLYFHTGNTQFTSCLTPLAFSDWDFAELVHADQQAPSVRRSAMKFLRGCFQRQLYENKLSRVVTKMNYSAMRIRSLAEEFPDAKFVYIARSPLETIPSHLTLHRNMFDHLWGVKRIPTGLLQRYYERRYQHNLAFYRYLEDVIESRALSSNQLLVIRYDDLRNQLAETLKQVIAFTNLPCSEKLRELIERQSQEQSRYERPHTNLPLGDFGLTKERLLADFQFAFDKYRFPVN